MPLASLPKPQEPLTLEGQHIQNTWYMAFVQLITNVVDIVIGPSSSTDNAIARWNGTTGKLLQNSVVPLADDGTFSFPDGIRQTFNPSATNAGLNVGAQAGNPSFDGSGPQVGPGPGGGGVGPPRNWKLRLKIASVRS